MLITNKQFFCLILFFLFATALQAKVSEIINKIEKKTDLIDTIKMEVLLSSDVATKTAHIYIKAPGKFLIEYEGGSVKCFYNGEQLWVYYEAIREAFYQNSFSDSGFFSFLPQFNLKKMFANLTKVSLYSLFDIEFLSEIPCEDSERVEYKLKFVPKMKKVFLKAFDIAGYEITISSDSFLPTKLIEFSGSGAQRATLTATSIQINRPMDDSIFDFVPPVHVLTIPMRVVFAQRLQAFTHELYDWLAEQVYSIKDMIFEWSF